jgi:hypothetical protein
MELQMNEQITIEQMQLIIGRLTMNYELQITNLQKHIQQLNENAKAEQATKVASPLTK